MRAFDYIDIGVVVQTYPQAQSIDVRMQDGSRLIGVQIETDGSSRTGMVDLPFVNAPADDTRWDPTVIPDPYMRAIIASTNGVPLCIGFLLPQVTQLTFNRQNFRIMRHASDVYQTINDAGDIETYHPSGTYLRIGSSAAHEDLTGQDVDGLWKIARNTAAAPHVHLNVANAGASVASIDIDPSGNITIQCNGNTAVNVGGNLSATVGGTSNVTSSGAATLKAPSVTIDSPQTEVTGSLTVDGALTFKAGMSGSGGSGGATMQIQGDVTVTGGEVTVDGIGVKGHHHTAQGDNAPTTPAEQ